MSGLSPGRELCTDPHVGADGSSQEQPEGNRARMSSNLPSNKIAANRESTRNFEMNTPGDLTSQPSDVLETPAITPEIIPFFEQPQEIPSTMELSLPNVDSPQTLGQGLPSPSCDVQTAVLTPAQDDSLDSSDVPFSQELLLSPATSDCTRDSTADSIQVSNEELRALCPASEVQSVLAQSCDSGRDLCEDIHSRLFVDFDDERYMNIPWEGESETGYDTSFSEVSEEELANRASNQQNGGLSDWDYDNPFAPVEVKIDDVDIVLGFRFVREANTVLDNVIEDISCRQGTQDSGVITPFSCFQTFLSDSLLEKLVCVANRVLLQRQKNSTNKCELRGIVILHALCAMYNESPTTVCDPNEQDSFYQMGISSDRYHEVWSSLSGSKENRAVHDYSATGWCRSANRATSLITVIESEVASINRELLYVEGATVFSLDDDHLRMSSRAVLNLTYLQQHNNPKKGLGPVGNALCSALNPLFIAIHFTRNGEKVRHTWERLAQLVQGASTNGALRPMPDSIFAADRGYNSKDTIQFVGATLGASLIGTHKRDLWYPYVFGDGPITARQRGVVVSEKGCRAVYNARLKSRANASMGIRNVEACIYRESCSGRIAALIHNNSALFPSRSFTVVLKESFRSDTALEELKAAGVVFDIKNERVNSATRSRFAEEGRANVDCALLRVRDLTYLQSEDPCWFLLRAFRFTSRTGHGFVAAIARDYNKRLRGMASHLRGKRISDGTDGLPDGVVEVERCLSERWEDVLGILGMQMQTIEQPSNRRELAGRLRRYSQSRVNSCSKSVLQSMLGVFGRSMAPTVAKAALVAAVLQLKQEIIAETVSLEDVTEGAQSEESTLAEATETARKCLLEASVSAWVMKPLVTTMGMREGSRNEIEVTKAIPVFFKQQFGAYSKRVSTHGYSFQHQVRLEVLHVRTTGLLESRTCRLLADSPDAIASAKNEDSEIEVFAVEIKTMTALRTIQSASTKAQKYGTFIVLTNVGVDSDSTEFFRELVPTTAYRAQTMHHAAALSLNSVLFVVATGASMTEGKIIYACMVNFAERVRHKYTFMMDCVRHTAFGWIGDDAKYIPKEYDDMLQQSHASDIHSFMSYYSLSNALRKCVEDRETPIPPSRMIRLTPTVYWNHLKGGVDVISRYMKTLARCNISENPVVSIIARILSMQASNAAVVYRLYCARQSKMLPIVEDYGQSRRNGYHMLRHDISQCETFGRFIRTLAREWVEQSNAEHLRRNQTERGRGEAMTPMFARNATERYNSGVHKARRLNQNLSHEKVSSKPTYCVLCSFAQRGVKEGKDKVKRHGSRQVQWCSVCRQAVCAACWDHWHRANQLKRARPTANEKRAFEASLRSVRARTT